MRSSPLLAASAAVALIAPLATWAQTPPPAAAAPPPAPTAAAQPSPNLAAAGDMLATLSANPNFSVLVSALKATNLAPVLASVPQLTLFAPTDAALNALPPGVLAALMKTDNLPKLQKILTFHLIHIDLDAAKLKGAKGQVPTVEGASVEVDGYDSTRKVNDAVILQDGVHATNGWIYPVDKVLVPPDVTLPSG